METPRSGKAAAHSHFLYGVVQGKPSPPGKVRIRICWYGASGGQEVRELAVVDEEEEVLWRPWI